jgi:hypothetical protein
VTGRGLNPAAIEREPVALQRDGEASDAGPRDEGTTQDKEREKDG